MRICYYDNLTSGVLYRYSQWRSYRGAGGKWKIRKFAIWGEMTPNYSAVLDFDYQLRRHVRKRNRAMFEQNIFHFSDFFLDKIDFNLDKIDFNLESINFSPLFIYFFHFSDFFSR